MKTSTKRYCEGVDQQYFQINSWSGEYQNHWNHLVAHLVTRQERILTLLHIPISIQNLIWIEWSLCLVWKKYNQFPHRDFHLHPPAGLLSIFLPGSKYENVHHSFCQETWLHTQNLCTKPGIWKAVHNTGSINQEWCRN